MGNQEIQKPIHTRTFIMKWIHIAEANFSNGISWNLFYNCTIYVFGTVCLLLSHSRKSESLDGCKKREKKSVSQKAIRFNHKIEILMYEMRTDERRHTKNNHKIYYWKMLMWKSNTFYMIQFDCPKSMPNIGSLIHICAISTMKWYIHWHSTLLYRFQDIPNIILS